MTSSVETRRRDATSLRILTETDLDILLFANEQVPIDRASLSEVATLAGIAETTSDLCAAGFFGDYPAALHRCVLTPDFHKGAGIPVGTVLDADGFVLPRCTGRDIGCGMRLIITDLTREAFDGLDRRLDRLLRHAFFEGGRDIALDEAGRAALLRDGVPGLRPPPGGGGIWDRLESATRPDDLRRTHHGGSWPTRDLWEFGDFVRGSGGVSHDAALASIGGGNHFCEIQYVDEVLDRHAGWHWGLRAGMVAIMVHSGSVGLGAMVGGHFVDKARTLHPRSMVRPAHGFHPLPTVGPLAAHGEAYLSAMGLAANFAVVNRLMLGALALRCLSDAVGHTVHGRLVYDAPHNLVWTDGRRQLHRKGACPAGCDPEFPDGHPVIVPGSMGDASYVLKGQGSISSLCSAPHGAGRLAPRGQGRRHGVGELGRLRVVTKIDLDRTRRGVAEELRKTLAEEAPSQYKPVQPVIDTVAAAGIASPVARLRPLLTVKG